MVMATCGLSQILEVGKLASLRGVREVGGKQLQLLRRRRIAAGLRSFSRLGKIGTDIQDNKCSWLVNQALTKVTPEQRKVLEDNYGRKDADNEAKVKEVYHELKLDDVYLKFEEERVGGIRKLISEVDESEGLKKGVFEAYLKKIYKRQK